MRLHLIIGLLIIFLLQSCRNDKDTAIIFPEGGYDYPKNIMADDANFYYYPIKNSEKKKLVFGDYYMYYLYHLFQEPNLSLEPRKKETFRLYYSDAFNTTIMLTLSDNVITIKEGITEGLYEDRTAQLSPIEKLHLKMLDDNYPIDEMNRNSKFIVQYDSMIKLYPQLLEVKYYHSIYEKSFARTNKKFNFNTRKFYLTTSKYDSLVKQLNASEFWSLPYLNEYKGMQLDGFTFVLEANTKKKYQVVRVQACADNVIKFTQFCQQLIELTHLGKEIDLICGEK